MVKGTNCYDEEEHRWTFNAYETVREAVRSKAISRINFIFMIFVMINHTLI